MPPVVSYNPKQDNNFILSEIMKHIKGVSTSNNQIEKPSEEQKALAAEQQQTAEEAATARAAETPEGEVSHSSGDTGQGLRRALFLALVLRRQGQLLPGALLLVRKLAS